MKELESPHNQKGEPPTHEPDETAERLEQKADEQQGEMNRARTEEQAREVKERAEGAEDGKDRKVRFGG